LRNNIEFIRNALEKQMLYKGKDHCWDRSSLRFS
jgi:hypothetical protein